MRKRWIIIIITIGAVLAVSVIAGSEYYTAGPQFCGLCHTPEKPYDSWAKSGHLDVKCVDCHFTPGKVSIIQAKLRGAEHLITSLFPEAVADDTEVRGPLKANNPGCITTQCHQGKKSLYSKINSAENVPLTHKPHDDRIIEGKTLNCGICHSDVKSEDYAVSQEACYLCNGLNHILEVYF